MIHWGCDIGLCCQQKEYSAAATLSAAFATAGQLLSLRHNHHLCHQRSWFHCSDRGGNGRQATGVHVLGHSVISLSDDVVFQSVHIGSKCFHFKACFGVIFDSVRDLSVYISLPQISSSPNSCHTPSMRSCQTLAFWLSYGHSPYSGIQSDIWPLFPSAKTTSGCVPQT